jgi:serine/threonine-protein kinase HipA
MVLREGYHTRCCRKLFGTTLPPKVPFSTPDVAGEAQKMVGKMSISGVQPKLSVIHDHKKHQLTVVERGGLYILKPPTERFESLPENENLCMNIASAYGIEVPSHGLLPLMDERLVYIVKRFDRLGDGSKLQQEDFQQLLQTNDKYTGSYERIAKFFSPQKRRDWLSAFASL